MRLVGPTKTIPVVSLSAVERALAATQVLLVWDSRGSLEEQLWLEAESCRHLVARIAASVGMAIRARDVSRYVRLDVGELTRALKSLERLERQGFGSFTPSVGDYLDEWLAQAQPLLKDLEALAHQQDYVVVSSRLPDMEHSGACFRGLLTRNQELFLSGVIQIARQRLASMRGWVQLGLADGSPALESSYRQEELTALSELAVATDVHLSLLAEACDLGTGPSPGLQALSQRLLEAYNAASTAFDMVLATWSAGTPMSPDLRPQLGELVARLKELHRQALPAS
ncbi:MAG: hypothetical protein ACUVWR_03790 [Anaerolineae bacterium]